jgi:hypothetical protein
MGDYHLEKKYFRCLFVNINNKKKGNITETQQHLLSTLQKYNTNVDI